MVVIHFFFSIIKFHVTSKTAPQAVDPGGPCSVLLKGALGPSGSGMRVDERASLLVMRKTAFRGAKFVRPSHLITYDRHVIAHFAALTRPEMRGLPALMRRLPPAGPRDLSLVGRKAR